MNEERSIFKEEMGKCVDTEAVEKELENSQKNPLGGNANSKELVFWDQDPEASVGQSCNP